MFEEILKKIASFLTKHKIPYMIIGGQAVLLHGEPRLTQDIDVTIGLSQEKLKKLLSAIDFSQFEILPKDVETFVKQTMVLPLKEKTTGIRIDFIFSYTPYEQHALKRVVKKRILNQQVCFASVEDLIIHKIFAGRPRDIEDVKSIILKNKYDANYIRKWLKEFDQSIPEKNFTQIFEEVLTKN